MPSVLRDICFDCVDPNKVARFWAAALGYHLELNDWGSSSERAQYALSPIGPTAPECG